LRGAQATRQSLVNRKEPEIASLLSVARNDKSAFMKLKPIHDHIVVKPIIEDEITKSGIVLPDTIDKEKPEKGEVVAVGSGKLLDNGQRAVMSVKVGDKVMFKKYSPDEIKVDGVEYLIISESDILGILE
jgi:chaperonin GroES